MADRIGQLDKGMSKTMPWHIGKTKNRWTVTDQTLTPDEAALIGWERQDGDTGFWNPRLVPVFAKADHDQFVKIPGSWHVVRDDMPIDSADRFISIGRGVGSGYTLITNSDIRDYANALCGAGAHVDSCGSLMNGQRVYMSLFLPQTAEIVDEPAVNHLLLTGAHDGTATFEAILALVLTVCWNTMQYNRRNATTRYKIKHTVRATERLAEAHRIITVAEANFGSSVDIYRRLALKKLSDDAARAFVESINGEGTRADKATNRVLELYHGEQLGADRTARRGTVWGLVNAFSQYIETEMTIRKHKDEDGTPRDEEEARMNSVIFGAGSRKRDEIINKALVLID